MTDPHGLHHDFTDPGGNILMNSTNSDLHAGALPATDGIHLLGLVNPVLRQRRTVVLTVLVLVFYVGVTTIIKARTYTSSASFMIDGRRGSSLQGLAAQFGIAVPTQEGAQSPNFYADLVKGREILTGVVDSPFVEITAPAEHGRTLSELLKITSPDPARRREATIVELRDKIKANVAQRTGVVSFTVTTGSPQLSWAISRRLVDALNRFNLQSRQSQAAAERRFTEGRLGEVTTQLRAAEADLLAFTQRNRDIRSAPELQVQQERLQREVSLRQQVFATLAQAVEQAKIEEVRDTPVLSTVEQPIVPPFPDRRGLAQVVVAATLVGVVLGCLLAIIRDRSRRASSAGEETMEFRALLLELGRDLRRPWRLVGVSTSTGRSG